MGESIQTLGLWNRREGLALVATAIFLFPGCASTETGDSGGMTFADRGAAVSIQAPAQLDRVEVEEADGEARVTVRADRSLEVHTSYREADGSLVVELPNTRAGRAPGSTAYRGAVISSVEVEERGSGDRPLTRIIFRTTPDAELAALEPVSSGLRMALRGVSSATAVASEPLPEAEVVERETIAGETSHPVAAEPIEPLSDVPVEAVAHEDVAAMAGPPPGTPDRPLEGPRPNGVVASRLLDVRLEEVTPAATVVRVVGDGEFRYSTFRLDDPSRFVLDLEGVVNTADRSALEVADSRLAQVRIGQFRPEPEPVSRVVFDLSTTESPRIEGDADGLTVVFGRVPKLEAAEAAPETAAEPRMAPTPIELAAATADPRPEPQPEAEPEEEDSPAPVETATLPIEEVSPPPLDTTSSLAAPAAADERYGDVALFEAQEMRLDEPEEVEDPTAGRIPPSFETLVVNQRDSEYVGEPISMSLKNADLVETLRSFAKISDLNFVIQPGVGGSVTVELKNVPWDQALEQILRINNLGMDIEGTIVRIAPVDQLQAEAEKERQLEESRARSVPLRTVMKAISYANANDVATLLRNQTGSLMSNRGTVQVDQRTNTLIIRELPGNIDTVLAVIENLDTAEPQVSIEARIIEATKTFARSLGIEWGYGAVADAEHGNTTGLTFPNNVQSDGAVGLLTGGANGFINLSLGNILNTFNLDARLQVAENEGLVNVISSPRVTTLNNNAASIQSGLQIPIQTVSNRTVSVQFVNATLQLQVTPQVTAEGTILLDINVSKRSPQLGLAVVGATNAPIATKEAQTKVIVRDGGTAVIGGIYEVSANAQQDRVPGLANIPVLGHLFKNRNRDDSNDELMIFITPRIVQL